MEYVLGVCPQCNNVMSMPGDSEKVRCPTCQSEVLLAEAAALAGASQAPAQPAQAQQPQQQAYQQPGNPYGQAPVPQQAPNYGQQPLTYTGAEPVLNSWTTNALYTVLGIAASIVLNIFTGSETINNSAVLSGALSILSLAYIVFCIVYAAKIYPSYFTNKPMISSNEAINFLNGFVGGIIWGLLWNHNLTLKKKGISHIVYIVLIGVSFVLGIALAFALAGAIASGSITI